MASCTGNPSNCGFCGEAPASHDHCAKTEVNGCTANPTACTVCNGDGCLAIDCTQNPATCKSCLSGHSTTCRRAEANATEGIDRPTQ